MTDFILEKGFAGQQADMTPATFVSAIATGTIKSGDPVALDGEGKCKKATNGTGFLGIACGTSTKREWEQYDSVRIMTQGSIYLDAATATTAGASVGFSSTSTWSDATASTYPTQIDGSKIDEASSGAGLIKVRLFGVQTTTVT